MKLSLPPAEWIEIGEPAISTKSSKDIDIEHLVTSLCKGDFSNLEQLLRVVPKPNLSVFVSSTFTDTQKGKITSILSMLTFDMSMLERNVILSSILPKLQKRGRSANIQVTIVDLRFE
jgi:hypothetical protein